MKPTMRTRWLLVFVMAALLATMVPATIANADPPMSQWDGVEFPCLAVVTYCKALVIHTEPKLDSDRLFTAVAGTLHVATRRVGNMIELETEKGVGYGYAAYLWPVAALKGSKGNTFAAGVSLYYQPGTFVAGFSPLGHVLFSNQPGMNMVGYGSFVAEKNSKGAGNVHLAVSLLNGNHLGVDLNGGSPFGASGWTENYYGYGDATAIKDSFAIGNAQVALNVLNGNYIDVGDGRGTPYGVSMVGTGIAHASNDSFALGNAQVSVSIGNGNGMDIDVGSIVDLIQGLIPTDP